MTKPIDEMLDDLLRDPWGSGISECPDYEELKAYAKREGISVKDTYVLKDDPFYITEKRQEQAKWFAEIWQQFVKSVPTHLRAIHYIVVSNKVYMLNGKRYENTEECQTVLGDGGKDARYLGLVNPEHFVDRRSPSPITYLADHSNHEIWVGEGGRLSERYGGLPEPAQIKLAEKPTIPQRYHVEIWAEKSTQNDILEPLARRYRCNLVTGVGEMSLTACDKLIERAKDSERPVRILYISDFDPGGKSMPVAVARKIEFGLRKAGLSLDIQVRPIALTEEQCREHQLPRTPIKEKEKRREIHEYVYGTGATELDALEALRPGLLRSMVVEELERYWDDDLDAKIRRKAERVEATLDKYREKIIKRHALSEIEPAWDDLGPWYDPPELVSSSIEERLSRLNLAYNTGIGEIAPAVNARQQAVADDLAKLKTKRIAWPQPCDGDEDDNPMFDGLRDYLTQLDRFHEHQQRDLKEQYRAEHRAEQQAAAHAAMQDVYRDLGISNKTKPTITRRV
jgi:hypothetical protein